MSQWIEDYASASAMGNFLNATKVKTNNLAGKTLVIKKVDKQIIKEEAKPVVSFNDIEEILSLNKGNAAILVEAFGSDELAWAGKKIQLVLTKKQFSGAMVDGITVVPVVA